MPIDFANFSRTEAFVQPIVDYSGLVEQEDNESGFS